LRRSTISCRCRSTRSCILRICLAPDTPRDLAKIFDSTEYAKWKSFRGSEDSRYVSLSAPRILMREPYGTTTVPVEAFNYEERVDGTNHDHYC
jgi:type VI secretion system protein ImpC